MGIVYWISPLPGRLGLMARPRGGEWLEADMQCLQGEGVDILVSALTDWEMEELELEKQAECCRTNQIELWRFPIYDRSIPSIDDAYDFILRLQDAYRAGKAVAVHCRMGIGRSAILTAGVLLCEGYAPGKALDIISQARGCPVPDTAEQTVWLDCLDRRIKAEFE